MRLGVGGVLARIPGRELLLILEPVVEDAGQFASGGGGPPWVPLCAPASVGRTGRSRGPAGPHGCPAQPRRRAVVDFAGPSAVPLAPLILVPGQSPSHAQNAGARCQRLIAGPMAPNRRSTRKRFKPMIRVRSTPQMRRRSGVQSVSGAFFPCVPLVFLTGGSAAAGPSRRGPRRGNGRAGPASAPRPWLWDHARSGVAPALRDPACRPESPG